MKISDITIGDQIGYGDTYTRNHGGIPTKVTVTGFHQPPSNWATKHPQKRVIVERQALNGPFTTKVLSRDLVDITWKEEES